jgi:cytochrome c-type biogenesis protein CcmH
MTMTPFARLLVSMLATTTLGVATGLAAAQAPGDAAGKGPGGGVASAPAAVAVPATVPAVSTAVSPAVSPGPGDEELLRSDRFRRLSAELRCLVCQNQSLADSSAELAGDLRNEVVRLMRTGLDDPQIKRHLVERYGDFVLYRPAFEPRNWALWLGPFAMLAIGAVVLWRMSRRRTAAVRPSREDTERVRRLLDDPS